MKELTVGRVIARGLLAVFLTFDIGLYIHFLRRLSEPVTRTSIALIVMLLIIWFSNFVGAVYLPDFKNGKAGAFAAAGWTVGTLTHGIMMAMIVMLSSPEAQKIMLVPFIVIVAEFIVRPLCYEVIKNY